MYATCETCMSNVRCEITNKLFLSCLTVLEFFCEIYTSTSKRIKLTINLSTLSCWAYKKTVCKVRVAIIESFKVKHEECDKTDVPKVIS